ncbi:MAG: hypothetical protein LBJ25_02445 [Candidatus Margulisbacteria bacterium]|jgi:hypothetical protein|nr:hypothetical protein [Candidatus Margulisiibacteriota bacterium]
MAPVSLQPNYPFNNGEYANGETSTNIAVPQKPTLPADYDPDIFQKLYDFVEANSAEYKENSSAKLSELVNAGALDPVNAAALNGLLNNPPNSPEELIERLPHISPTELNKIVNVLLQDKYFEFQYKEKNVEVAGIGKIAEVSIYSDDQTSEVGLTDFEFSTQIIGENLAGNSAALTIKNQGEAGFSLAGESLSLAGEAFNNQPLEIRVEKFAALNSTTENGLPLDLFNIAAHNFSANGTHSETGVEWSVSAAEAAVESEPESQTGSASGINFTLVKNEHNLNISVEKFDIAADTESYQVELPGSVDTPALAISYLNAADNGLRTDLTIGRGSYQSAGSIFPENPARLPFSFDLYDINSQTYGDFLVSVAELHGKIEDPEKKIHGRGARAVGKNISASLDVFNFQHNSGLSTLSMQKLNLQVRDGYFSLGSWNTAYNDRTNDLAVSAQRLAARYGDYGMYFNNFAVYYNAVAKQAEFQLDAISGIIDLDKPLPVLPQDMAAPEAWQDYLRALTENNVTFAGSVDDLGGFLTKNVWLKHSPYSQALLAIAPHLDDVAVRFDSKLTTYLMDDPDADTLVWLNEYTDGWLGGKVNQFVDAYLNFGRNVYQKQHGLGKDYYQKFALRSALLAEEGAALDLHLTADPYARSAAVSLDYSAPWFKASMGYTHEPTDGPALSMLGLDYYAEHIFNSRLSLGHEILRLNVDTAWAVGQWRLGGESSRSLLGLMDKYDLAFWQADKDKWYVKPLLDLPALPFVNPSLSSRIPLPRSAYTGFDISWRPHLENYGHERGLLESISWDNFLANFSLGLETATGFSLKFEILAEFNRSFSSAASTVLTKGMFSAELNL